MLTITAASDVDGVATWNPDARQRPRPAAEVRSDDLPVRVELRDLVEHDGARDQARDERAPVQPRGEQAEADRGQCLKDDHSAHELKEVCVLRLERDDDGERAELHTERDDDGERADLTPSETIRLTVSPRPAMRCGG
jgi:hypothetical protein